MLINGKEVEYTPQQAISIQSMINQADEIDNNLKSGLDPKKIEKDEQNNLEGISAFSNNLEISEELRDRKNRYNIFREMSNQEFIHRGLEIIADDSTQSNSDGNVLTIYADQEKKELLEDLFFERLDINYELWSIVYETAKMGDNFYEIVPDDYKKPKKIVAILYREPEKIEKIEKDGRLLYYKYTTQLENNKNGRPFSAREKDKIEYKLQPWQIIHFKFEDKQSKPYGGSLLKAGVRSFRRLNFLEDVLLIYRVSRAPERRVFYVDVGGLSPSEAKQYINRLKNIYRSESFIDENGNINKKANIMSINTDIIVPRREGQGTQIESLPGGEALSNIDDLKYWKDKILRTMNIPSSYMGDEANRVQNLSALDQKFGRFIERIQAQILQGIYKIAVLELFFNGYKKEDLKDFSIELTPPSNVKELTDLDVINNRMNVVGTIKTLDLFSDNWIMKNILKMSDKEIADVQMEKMMAQQAGGQAPGAEGAEGEFAPVTGGDEVFAGPEGAETPPEGEAPAEEPPVEGEGEQLAASTIVKVLGKEFLIENKNDFFKLMKVVRESNVKSKNSLFEMMSEYVLGKEDKKVYITESEGKRIERSYSSKNPVKKFFLINEMGGISYTKEGRKLSLYEKEGDGKEEFLIE